MGIWVLRKFAGVLVLAASVAGFGAPVLADRFSDAVDALQRRDYEAAMRLFMPLAERGNASAQFNVGVMYANGEGVARDVAQAANWYKKAADQGEARAQFNLGYMYFSGQGLPKDSVKAYLWLDLAAQHLPDSFANRKTEILRNRDMVASGMTPSQVAEAKELVRTWKATSD